MPDWYLTKDGDKSCLELYERHYSAYHYRDGRQRNQCVGPGSVIFLRTALPDAIFVWRKYIDDTIPKQEGVECSVFRNEGSLLSSDLIKQADAVADHCWPGERHYTKVRKTAVRSTNAGYCFLKAGWRRCGMTKNGLIILERLPGHSDRTALHPYGTLLEPVTPGRTWEDCIAADLKEERDAVSDLTKNRKSKA